MRRATLALSVAGCVAAGVLASAAVADTGRTAATRSGSRFLVGAATEDITPSGVVNLGGFGLGDGSFFPQELVGRGGQAGPSDARIRARAVVFDDGRNAVAIADIETQGMFAAYDAGPYGLRDMAEQVARDVPRLPVSHVLIASDHTHHGPDTIGAWGGVPAAYLKLVRDQTVKAIEAAYRNRRPAEVRAGESDASGLIYNQGCTEALNQDPEPAYPGPDVCPVPGKDGTMRVIQARTPSGETIVTFVAFAAHSTTNMGRAIDGDWPQFLGDHLAATYGGVGIGMEGANGGTQPCRPTCSFTPKTEPGYGKPRFEAILANYSAHVADALAHARPVQGPVAASQRFIREAIVGPFVNGLFMLGNHTGTPLMRSKSSPWMVGQTVRTVVGDIRVGDLLFNGTPGEGFAAIRQGVADSVEGPRMVIQLGLANDQLGYLIAPTEYAVPIASEAAVNDNILFNVSPQIGDHVMCANIALAADLAVQGDWTVTTPPRCLPFFAQDAPGDPLGDNVPVGGVSVP